MLGFVRKILRNADEYYCTKQIDAFFAWTVRAEIPTNAIAFIDLPSQYDYINCRTRKILSEMYAHTEHIQFILCEPGKFKEILKKLNYVDTVNDWGELFFSPEIEIREWKGRYGKNVPLRFGLSSEERRMIFTYLTQALYGAFRTEDRGIKEVIGSNRLNEVATAEVIIWVGGILRGAFIVENEPFLKAVLEAGPKALQDKRFKPLTVEELDRARIEIHWISDLKVPISERELDTPWPMGRKGYIVEYEEERGWYVPAMFNLMRFDDTRHVIKNLIKNKTRIPDRRIGDTNVRSYMTSGFMGPEPIFIMDGPVAFRGNEGFGERKPGILNGGIVSDIQSHGDAAATFLLNIQDEDGYMPLYIDPLNKRFGGMDWVRMALTLHSLVEYGNIRNNNTFISAAEKGVHFLESCLQNNTTLSIQMRAATLVSLGNAHYGLKNFGKVKKIESFLKENLSQFSYGYIFSATLASFFARSEREECLDDAVRISHVTFHDFQKRRDRGEDIGLSDYAELLNAFAILEKRLQDRQYRDKASEIRIWLLGAQMSLGAFKVSRRLPYPHSRGTAKIFEVLSLNYKENRVVIEEALRWLYQMQYTEDNLYFTNEIYKEKSIGGFRSSYANTEAWIDGPGHFLLGVQRVLCTQPYSVDK